MKHFVIPVTKEVTGSVKKELETTRKAGNRFSTKDSCARGKQKLEASVV